MRQLQYETLTIGEIVNEINLLPVDGEKVPAGGEGRASRQEGTQSGTATGAARRPHATAIASISRSISIGHPATDTKVRLGGFSGKCFA